MSLQEFIEFGAQLALVVAGIVEGIKQGFLQPLRQRQQWTDEFYTVIVSLLAVVTGIVVAFAAGPQADFMAAIGITGISPLFGVLFTGFAIAFGNQFWHTLLDFTKTLTDLARVWTISQMNRALIVNAQIEAGRPKELK